MRTTRNRRRCWPSEPYHGDLLPAANHPRRLRDLSAPLNNDLPDAYNEWSNLHLKRLSDVQRQGEVCQEIKVEPDEFARFAAGEQVHAQL